MKTALIGQALGVVFIQYVLGLATHVALVQTRLHTMVGPLFLLSHKVILIVALALIWTVMGSLARGHPRRTPLTNATPPVLSMFVPVWDHLVG
jgi:ABC-type long-subunit fatty acid transport system fused permease/ATPase subunit